MTEIARVTSPDGKADAVVLQDFFDGGATGYAEDVRVLIVPKGRRLEEQTGNFVLEASGAEGYGKDGRLVPEWKGDDRLLLRLKRAHVTRYDNQPWGVDTRSVAVRLQIESYGDLR